MRWAIAVALCVSAFAGDVLEPLGHLHIPIGIPNSLDTLKTFVEAEGNFSPGFATCGISFWVYDGASEKLVAPTMPGVACAHGLAPGGLLIPWSEWRAGDVAVRSEVCEVQREATFIVGARAKLTNTAKAPRTVSLYAAVQPVGAAGAPIQKLVFKDEAVFANEHLVLVANQTPTGAEAPLPTAEAKQVPAAQLLRNPGMGAKGGDASGALRFDVTLSPGESRTFGFVCPVLHGRRAVGHDWDGTSKWAQLDRANPILGSGGTDQPSPPVAFYRAIEADDLFVEAERDARKLTGKVGIELPDPRWGEAFNAITSHVAIAMNEGAPDVSVINYNVFSRDGVYVANILQKSGNTALAAEAIDYFLAHPFNGRIEPEADNPGQILWILGEHWLFTKDRVWLARIYPAAQKLAAMIAYYRTTPEPHWVSATSLDFGEALPEAQRERLRPGACDGTQPRYTEAFDLAGMRAASMLAGEMENDADRERWSDLAARFFGEYGKEYAADLGKDYGKYCVLWPCRLFPLASGPAFEQFKAIGAQEPAGWRYFPLARAHQGLLAGNRAAAAETLAVHLEHEQMRGWYAFDEGGPSGPGNWTKVRSNWTVTRDNHDVDRARAMPHGWAIAEFQLLLRDGLAYEEGDRLVLFAGVPAEWFEKPMRLRNFPTHFGPVSVNFRPTEAGGSVEVAGTGIPPGGFIVRAPWKDLAIPAGEKSVSFSGR